MQSDENTRGYVYKIIFVVWLKIKLKKNCLPMLVRVVWNICRWQRQNLAFEKSTEVVKKNSVQDVRNQIKETS